MIPSVSKTFGSAIALGLASTVLWGCESGPAPVALDVHDTNGFTSTADGERNDSTGEVSTSDDSRDGDSRPGDSRDDDSRDSAATETDPELTLGPPPADVDTAVTPETSPNDGPPDAPASDNGCWSLPVITRARLFPAPGKAAELVGAKIVGSNRSAMNDFVDLGVITSAPAEGTWLELPLGNATAYRYVKYFSAPGSHGAVAEVEFYAGAARLPGAAYGTAGSLDGAGNTFDRALDANTASYFEGPLLSDSYVGLDLAAGHVVTAPLFSPPAGEYLLPPQVTLTAAAGAELVYTLDGSDPAVAGLPYTGPLTLPAQATLLRAQARQSCALPSETSQAIFRVTSAAPNPGSPPPGVQSSLHIGNSLTDTIVDYLEPLAQSGGVLLDFNRYTIPGAGTWMYAENPSGGFGVADVQLELKSRAFDHLTVQPFPNEPCQIVASSAGPDSDSGFINQAWTDARTQNPDVQLWVYQQWPDPVDYTNCITGGGWVRADDVPSCGDVSSTSCWQPPDPASWEDAVQNELAYDEAIVDELVQLQPDAPRPYIVPGGLGLSHLHAAIDAGLVPGFTNFFGQIFQASGADIHLTNPGAYFISLIFYACMFQSNPSATELDASYGVTAEQARVLQAIAWETVTSYASSGVAR